MFPQTMELSVVIPCYNEERRIETTLQRILPFLREHTNAYEVIVVNDGSTDKTSEIVARFQHERVRLLQNSKNEGKGYSVRRGVLEANYPWILFSDADLSTPIEELLKFRQYQGYSILIGSRALKGSVITERQPFYRVVLGKTFNKIVQLIGVYGIKDTQCGFKLFQSSAAKDIFRRQTLHGFSFDVEILYLAKRLGYGVKEVPVVWKNSPESKVNTFKEPWMMLKDIMVMRMRHRELCKMSKNGVF